MNLQTFNRRMVFIFIPIIGIIMILWSMMGNIEKGYTQSIKTTAIKDEIYFSTPGWARPNHVFKIIVDFKMDYPNEISAGIAFIIGIQIRIIGVEKLGASRKGSPYYRNSIVDAQIQSLLTDPLNCVLSIAGAEVSPSESPLSSDGRAWWSVRIDTPGIHHGVVSVYQKRHKNSKFRPIYRIEPRRGVDIEFHVNRSTSFANIFSWIIKFLGLVLTLPGIIALYDNIKKRRAEKKEKNKPKIIVP